MVVILFSLICHRPIDFGFPAITFLSTHKFAAAEPPPMSGKLSAALLFLYFIGGRDRMMIWDIHRNEKRLC
jgi:hypothetical protein